MSMAPVSLQGPLHWLPNRIKWLVLEGCIEQESQQTAGTRFHIQEKKMHGSEIGAKTKLSNTLAVSF